MEPTIKCGKQLAEHANLSESRFHDVNLAKAEFNNACLAESRFHDVDLAKAEFDDVCLAQTRIHGR